ncbi:tryptophan synthase subunit alpha [Balneatrix alpica]|uniref:Tryptophan synthase alpha chain n=1 Tax=Balneatrix alpica TaxID=75684 RepID=A0ABV5ZF43_9GAMM|nr:tryptophan synthase subunit alpha [Balneatrix alpica]
MSRLSQHIARLGREQDCLIMSHTVVGYPNLAAHPSDIATLAESGIGLMELQIPFSDPVADGPTLADACHQALQQGGSVATTLALAAEVCPAHPQVGFIVMSYLNPLYRYGFSRFCREAAAAGVLGLIIPDLTLAQLSAEEQALLEELDLPLITMVTPLTSETRLQQLLTGAAGMVYAVARSGVTGSATEKWGLDFQQYMQRLRRATALPIAVGFGIQQQADIQALRGQAQVAAVCSQTLRWQQQGGTAHAAQHLAQLVQAGKE